MGVLAACTALAGTAVAEPQRAEAVEHFDQGEAYFRAKAFDKAAVEYQAAHDLIPKPGLLFNIALSHERAGHITRAIEFYERYLADDPRGERATETAARIEVLSRKLAAARRASEGAAEVSLRRDRALLAATGGDAEAAIANLRAAAELSDDPEIVFELAGAYRMNGDDAAALAEYQRYLGISEATVHRAEAARHAAELEDRRALATRLVVPTRPELERKRPSLVPGFVFLGGSVVFAGVGVGYGMKADRIQTELDGELRTGTPPIDSNDPRWAQRERAAARSQIAFGAAGAAFVVGAVLTGRALFSDGEVTPKPKGISVQPTAGPGYTGVTLGGTW